MQSIVLKKDARLSSANNLLIVHSPHSGRAGELTHALELLQQAGSAIVDTLSIATLDGLPPQGANWQQRGVDLVIAAGGDGLVGGVITHIVEAGLPLAILPLGTANDIARSLAIPQHLPTAIEVIATGHERQIDIGVAQPAQQTPHASHATATPVEQQVSAQKHGYFAHVLTVGLNVQFARLATNVAARKRFGRLNYPFAALEVLRNHTAIDMQLRFEELALYTSSTAAPTSSTPPLLPTYAQEPMFLQCRTLQATVINAPIFGGQWQLSIPGASLSDGLLDIVVIEEVELGRLSTTFARLFSAHEQQATTISEWHNRFPTLHPAELTGIPGVHHVRARGVSIITDIDPQDVTLDGEVRGQTPVYAQIAQQRLRVIVPPHYDETSNAHTHLTSQKERVHPQHS